VAEREVPIDARCGTCYDLRMGRAAPLPPPGFDEMSVEDKIEYVQALWDRIAANESQVPVPDWHREVLHERLADYQTNPDQGRPWEEVEADLLKRRG
jgi:putative addiction module component (TIGR02574 family)